MTAAGEALRAFLGRHRRVLVLSGAGCSAPSGIPDYRDREGAWKHRRPMTFADFTASPLARKRYWAGSLRGWPVVRDARPNPAHASLAVLEAHGRVHALVTQNVDGLHQRAGSRRVVDLHGRLDAVECLGCGARVSREDVQALLEAWNPAFAGGGGRRPDGDAPVSAPVEGFAVPDCPSCGGTLKPAVVFFGENVPRARAGAATTALAEADALLVVGSSLMVWSSYRLVRAAHERGIETAAVNLGRTRADGELALKLDADCAAVLPEAVGAGGAR